MNKQKMIVCLLALGVAGLAQADTVFSGGDSTVAGNWDNGLPGAGNNGIMNVSGALPGGAQNTDTFAGATMTLGGDATFTAGADLACGGTDWIINNATVNLGDDLFDNGSVVTLNAGSAVNANDDFEAQGAGGGWIIINGGTHTAGDYFGFQDNATKTRNGSLQFLGGTVTAARFRFDDLGGPGTSHMDLGGSATATATGTTVATDIDGDVNILAGWSGSLTAANFSGDNWKNAVVAGDWSVNGTDVDGSNFDTYFTVTNGGQTLTIPEPATLGLVAAFGGAVLFIRRRFMI